MLQEQRSQLPASRAEGENGRDAQREDGGDGDNEEEQRPPPHEVAQRADEGETERVRRLEERRDVGDLLICWRGDRQDERLEEGTREGG